MFNDERLYINGKQVDLSPSSIIAKTLQVNDISSIDDRQANFTRNIDIPKTPNNKRIFNYLGVVGNDSNIPYSKNTANYYIGNECLIFDGWAIVSETTDVYKVNIYDGVIDFYKAIENKTFSEIELSGLTHTKNLENVTNSWSGSNQPYKYILADYGGKVTYSATSGTHINLDYLTPAVNVKWLWDGIFENFNATYSGDVFSSSDFTNLWVTYPKGLLSTEDDELLFESDEHYFVPNGNVLQNVPNTKKSEYLRFFNYSTSNLPLIGNNIHFQVAYTSLYRIELSGSIKSYGQWQAFDDYHTMPAVVDIWLAKNVNSNLTAEQVIPLVKLASNIGDYGNFYPEAFNINTVISLEAEESICFIARSSNGANVIYIDNTEPIVFKLSQVTEQEISFENALADFKIKDFFNEILWRFGLTIFKDKYTNNYEFLTLAERLATPEIVDWTEKFNGLVTEKYTLGSYAQNNVLAYSYNDNKNDHKNGSIIINNVNLDDSKTLIQSKIFAPEMDQTNLLPFTTNVYKLFEKEIDENDGIQTIKYKGLDKRFCFLRSTTKTFPSKLFGSELLVESTSITSAPFESFVGLSFQDCIQNYYSDFQKILDKSKLILAKIHITPKDIADFDFKKLYFIAQLGGYFIVNKINNYLPNKVTNVELIKVDYLSTYAPPVPVYETIDAVLTPYKNTGKYTATIDVEFPAGYNTLMGAYSYMYINGVELKFNSFVNTGGNTYRLTSKFTTALSYVDEMHIDNMMIVISNGVSDIYYNHTVQIGFDLTQVTDNTPEIIILNNIT